MKTLILSVLIVFALCGYCDAVYVIINPDNSIHCFEEKPNEQLVIGRQRFDLDEMPAKHHIYYNWVNGELVERPLSDVQADIDAFQKKVEIQEKISAQIVLMAISELELSDTGENYSSERLKHEKIINDRKDGE